MHNPVARIGVDGKILSLDGLPKQVEPQETQATVQVQPAEMPARTQYGHEANLGDPGVLAGLIAATLLIYAMVRLKQAEETL